MAVAPRRRIHPWMIVGSAFAVAAISGAGVFVVTRDDDKPRQSNIADDEASRPEAAVRSYFDAFSDGDCQVMAGMASQGSMRGLTPSEAVEACEDTMDDDILDSSFRVDDVEVVSERGNRATVRVEATVDGDAEIDHMTLVRENGIWKLDLADMQGDADRASPRSP